MKPHFIVFHLICFTFASLCYAQSSYQYPRPTNQASSVPLTEQSQGQNSNSKQPNQGFNKLSQNQSPNQSPSNGYQYNRPTIAFTTTSPQLRTVGFPTSQRTHSSYADSSTASYTFRNENSFSMTDGGFTQSGPDASFSGYSSRVGQSLVPNAASTSATLPTYPGSNGSGTSSGPTGYQGGTGPGTFGSEFQRSFPSSSPNQGSVGSPSSFNSGGLNSLGQSSENAGYGGSPNFNSGSAGSLGPSSASTGDIGFSPSPGFNGGNANSANPRSPFVGNSGSGSLSNSNVIDGNGSGSDNDGDFSAIPGVPKADYPILTQIPQTAFSCTTQKYPGYYADVEARCQVFHICSNGLKYDFLCPNGTIFSQMHFVCVWWNQFDCSQSESLYYLNENLYKIPSSAQRPAASFNGAFDAQQSQGVENNFKPSAASQEFGSQGNGLQELQPQGSSNSFGPSTSSQMTSVNFDVFSNTQAPLNQQPSALYGSPTLNNGVQAKSPNARPQQDSSYIPPALSTQNNHQTSFMNSGSSQISSSSGPFPETAPPEYSTLLQATTAPPISYQTGENAPLNAYTSSTETSFQNYLSNESPNSPFLSNKEMKPSREYLPPFNK